MQGSPEQQQCILRPYGHGRFSPAIAQTTHALSPPRSEAGLVERLADCSRRLLLWLPLVPVAVGMAAGIVFDRYVPIHWGGYLAAFLLAGVLLTMAYRADRGSAVLAVATLVLAAAAVGGVRHQATFWRLPADHIFNFIRVQPRSTHVLSPGPGFSAVSTQPHSNRASPVSSPSSSHGSSFLARLRGCIVSVPVIRQPEQRVYGIPMSDRPHSSFLLETQEVLSVGGWVACSGLVRVSVRGPADHVRLGDVVEVYASLRTISGPRNPGEHDWRMYNRRGGLYVAAMVDQPQSIARLPQARGGWFGRLLGGFRRTCQQALLDGIVAEEPTAGLLVTYVAGQRSAVSRQINDAFRRSGTAHLLAVSGSHVAMIAAFGGFAGWLLLGRPRRAALVALAGVIFFSVLVEASAPSLRSGIMAMLAVMAVFANRPFNSGNWLAGSAVVLLVIAPTDLFSPAFQMTFAAVAALILLTRAVCITLFGPWDLAGWIRLRIRIKKGLSWWYTARLNVRNAFSYSVAAWLANVPLAAWHFGQFNLYGPIATLLILPLATLTLILGFCKMVLGLASPSAGSVLAGPVECLADWMARFAAWMGAWPGATLAVPPPPLWLVAVMYGALGYWAITMRQRWYDAWPIADRVVKAVAIPPVVTSPYGHGGLFSVGGTSIPKIYDPIRPQYVVAAAAGLLGIYAWVVRPADPDHLRLHVLSVGDGLCVVVRGPAGKTLLYDCGSISVGGVGERVVVPALLSLGIRRIDAAVLSHANLDHYSGLIEVADAVPIGEVWLDESFRRQTVGGLPGRLLKDLETRGIPLRDAATGTWIDSLGPACAEVLWPPAGVDLSNQDPNDASLVIRVELAGRAILLTGDIGEFAQGRLMRDQPGRIRADVLVLPHHGRTKTLDPDFLTAVGPRVAIASTASLHRPGQVRLTPPPGCRLLDTESGGMVTVDLTAEEPRVETFVASPVLSTR